MRKIVVIAMALLCLGSFSYAEIPDLVKSEDSTAPPLWVSADVVFPAGGATRLDLFSEDTAGHLQETLRSMTQKSKKRFGRRRNNCAADIIILSEASENEAATFTLERHFAKVWQVYSGVIVGIEHGFSRGFQKAMIEISVDGTFKRANGQVPASVFVIFKFGEIETPHGKMCLRSRRHPDEPTIGSRAVFFAREPALSGFHLGGRDNDLYFEREDGTVSAPGYFGDQTLSMPEIEALFSEVGGAR